ncbi:MAG: T9SS type A sorting domain-containing protein [Bacteroidota bacterium]|nr:T9SS type A sorting domain-containing protein [Bacteroidota bacterium]MDP4216419.1 T9SS type A sorting domain-containing protein [Bacteroidota bacterium]MDP4244563.1 T9SS type A sorting domain-containing protein [Bacteroidota bacterium]MDP4254302.1 T9SS type A sorting domain-containing protein [Bacteroidota bacterium]MDP4257609.1 T9SS type A sorting domain-containing protein [Bacteroidota bacterium]
MRTRSLRLFTGLMAMNLVLALAISSPSFASGRTKNSVFPPVSADTNNVHSILVNKSLVSKKYKIGLYPDARNEVLFFSANGGEKKVYQLYLFDMDGKLVNQAIIRNRETTVLTNIPEGSYLFQVFSNDERIEDGQLTVN